MRRNEFEVTDEDTIKKVLAECEYGTLSLIANGEPYGVALNFVLHKGNICFHGAQEGRKVDAIKTNPYASFLAVRPYSVIPSYFSNTRAACPATHFFASVHVYGKMSIVKNLNEKAEVLEAMMQKLQSEGGYDTIRADNPIYTKMLEETGVYILTPKKISLKIKAGQNLPDERKSIIIQKLMHRDKDGDKSTLQLMLSLDDEN